jgi:DNA-binding beta-propeller fold protein YncE
MMRRALGVFLLLTACASTPPASRPIEQSVVDDQTRTTIESLREAVAADPTDGARIYALAQYLDRTGDTAESLKWLGELDRIGWTHGVNDHDFLATAKLARYRAVASRLNDREPHVVRSTDAFVIPQRDLIPEGIAWDPTTGDFFVSSIHLRKVVRITSDGKSSDFVHEGQDGLFGTLGLKVDPQRRLLWIISNAAREMNGYTDALDGQSSVLAYDLNTGKLATKIDYGSAHDPSLLNDLAILDDGSVVITDSDGGGIMRVRLGSDTIENWIPDHTFTFPNGIAVAEGEPFVYVADFGGLSRIDVRSRTITPLIVEGETLAGIDGLTTYHGDLIGIQNGVGLPRVVRVSLNATRDAITHIEVIEAGNPQFDEPTTGVIANGAFYFMANPQLRAFDENHRIWPRERLRDVVVLRLPLD